MKKFTVLFLIALITLSCKNDKKQTSVPDESEVTAISFDDSSYVLNNNYPIGDVRRYGVFPDSIHSKGHPFSKKSRIETILDLSSDHDIEMVFPKGYYDSSIVLKGKKNISLTFDDAEFGGIIQIIEEDSTESSNIRLQGKITTYSGFFSRKSSDINIEELIISSDITKNIFDIRSKGCQIYAGSKNVKINKLIIDDLGSGNEKYKYVNSALSIEGWNNNPENVQIKSIHIKSSDRHGIYLTGRDHLIGNVVIDKFGMGNAIDMSPMQDAQKGEEKDFKALWVNKCYDSFIENITINEKESKGKYTAHFDSGDKSKPVTIGILNVVNDNPKINIIAEDNNGVVIESQE